MPIYSYRCDTCGFQQDVLRKMSDPLLVTCPSCGASTFRKQVTAAGFQLKGSGWYVTDFRNPAAKDGAKGAAKSDGDAPSQTSDGAEATPAAPAAATKSDGASPAAKADAAPAKPPAPAPGGSA